ncbi:MAG TPA: TetR/AcrR family transcriptional regulator [Propionibacteriaceae bacterium]|nr:TetR/AcrR family transcriptional regulator [Propionibacteriaceae bacterium]
MVRDVRARMVTGAMRLLATGGVQQTSIQNLTQATGTPRGSVYHFFPQGKGQLIEEALGESCRLLGSRLAERDLSTPVAVVRAFVDVWRSLLVATDFRLGCAVVGVTVTSENDAERRAAHQVFSTWTTHLVDHLVRVGLCRERAITLAHLLLAGCEGAVVLCRARRDLVPLDAVEREIVDLVSARDGADRGRELPA